MEAGMHNSSNSQKFTTYDTDRLPIQSPFPPFFGQAIAFFMCDGTMAGSKIAERIEEAIQLLESVGLEVCQA